jgi:hypothetical protein
MVNAQIPLLLVKPYSYEENLLSEVRRAVVAFRIRVHFASSNVL